LPKAKLYSHRKSPLPDVSQAHWQQQIPALAQFSKELVWFNPLNSNSLRLTKYGLAAIPRKEYQAHTINLAEKIKPGHYLLLERAMPAPYYIKKMDQIYVYDEQVAIMLTLHAGDLGTYLTNLLTY
jgi:hypothetical protein